MADSKISLLTEATEIADNDWIVTVDVDDTTQAVSGTTKKAKRSLLRPIEVSYFFYSTRTSASYSAKHLFEKEPYFYEDTALGYWQATTATNQRIIALFKNGQQLFKALGYVNAGRCTGTGVATFGNTNAQNFTLYAVTSDIVPSNVHGNLAGLTSLATGTFNMASNTNLKAPDIFNSFTATTCYGFVVDIDDAYVGATRIGMNRLIPL